MNLVDIFMQEFPVFHKVRRTMIFFSSDLLILAYTFCCYFLQPSITQEWISFSGAHWWLNINSHKLYLFSREYVIVNYSYTCCSQKVHISFSSPYWLLNFPWEYEYNFSITIYVPQLDIVISTVLFIAPEKVQLHVFTLY